MKITDIELLKVPPSWVWVRIHTDAGLTGLGEPYLENHPGPVIAEVERLTPLLIDEDPTRPEALWQKLYHSGLGYVGGPVKMSALSGIDIALWDLAGKAAGLPIYKLLGGPVPHTGQDVPRHRWFAALVRGTGRALSRGPCSGLRPGARVAPSVRRSRPAAGPRVGLSGLKVHFGPGDGLEATRQVDAICREVCRRPRGRGA